MNTGYGLIERGQTQLSDISRFGEIPVWGSLDRLYYVKPAEIASQEAFILGGMTMLRLRGTDPPVSLPYERGL